MSARQAKAKADRRAARKSRELARAVRHAAKPARRVAVRSFFVVLDHPPDLPGGFVVRRYHVVSDRTQTTDREPVAWDAPTLDDARAVIPAGLRNVGRSPKDDPKIVEVWV